MADTAEDFDDNANKRRLKVTVVGDSGVGKTCLLMAFANNKFPEEKVDRQSLFENSKGTIKAGCEGSFEVPVPMDTADGQIELGLTDTIGTEDYRKLREVFAAKTDVFLVCFSVTEPETLENVRNSWLTEIRMLTPKAPFILVGLKTDLREDTETLDKLEKEGKQAISLLQGIKLAKSLGAKEYTECSSLNMVSVKGVFGAVVVVMDQDQGKNNKRKKNRNSSQCSVS